MVKIPAAEDFSPSLGFGVDRNVTPATTHAAISNAGAPGQAVAGLGRAVSGLGASLKDLADKKQKEQEQLEDFNAAKGFEEAKAGLNQDLTKAAYEAPEDGTGITKTTGELADGRFGSFLSSLPPRLRPKYDAMVAGQRGHYVTNGLNRELSQREKYYTSTIGNAAEGAAVAIEKDPDAYDAQAETITGLISSSGLSPASKRALLDKVQQPLLVARLKGLVAAGRNEEALKLAQDIEKRGAGGGGGGGHARGAIEQKVEEAASAAGLPLDIVMPVVRQESNFNPSLRPIGKDGRQLSSALGIFQLLKAERQAAGIGDSTNPDDQIPVGIRKMKSVYETAKRALGRDPTAGEFYVVYYQGEGAGPKILRNPGGDFRATVGQKVIDANPWLANIQTNGDFIAWTTKRMAARGAGSSAFHVSGKTPTDFVKGQIDARERTTTKEQARERTAVKGLMEDDANSIAASGQPVEVLTRDRVEKALGPDAADTWERDRETQKRFYEETHDFESLPQDEILAHLEKMAPQPGAAGYTEQAQTYEAARKKADAIIKQRAKDPVGSVANDPEVKKASAAFDAAPNDPKAGQALIDARLKAQQRIGIPKAVQEPITTSEAQAWLKPLKDAMVVEDAGAGGKGAKVLRKAQDDLAAGLRAIYGDYADEVMVSIIASAARSQEEKEATGEVLRLIMKGDKVTGRAQAQAKAAVESADAAQAMGADKPAPPEKPGDQVEGGSMSEANLERERQRLRARGVPQPEEDKPATFPRPSTKALAFLTAHRDDPAVVAKFIATFGQAAYQNVAMGAEKPKTGGTTTVNDDGSENWTPE